jgi:hypothetical protein
MSVHGELKGSVLFVYDEQESEVMTTFMNEVIEFKLKRLTRVYQSMINSLIDGYEKLAYQEKEDFIDFIPKLTETHALRKSVTKSDSFKAIKSKDR